HIYLATAVKLDHYAIKDCCGPTLQKPAQHICQALYHVMIAYLQFVSVVYYQLKISNCDVAFLCIQMYNYNILSEKGT
ncbi:MAG: hypothetical protein PWQ93_861, partial [Clostridiales bacterium]|nr:hypothetical protein [Clostridiales bacterium]